MPKLNLRQNALHTLHHAIEHLQWSQSSNNSDKRVFDHDDHSVSWREGQSQCFVLPDFTRLPAEYNLKFAILHLIQAAELLLKSYAEQHRPEGIFASSGPKTRTIGLHEALKFAVSRTPDLFTPEEMALLLQAKDLRNNVEHYQLTFDADRLRGLCIDFVAICMLISEELLSINIVDTFSWDALGDKSDPVGQYLGGLMHELSATGKGAARRTASSWTSKNASEPVFLCLNCGVRAVSRDRGVCMGCGVEGDADVSTLLEEFRASVETVAAIEKRIQKARAAGSCPSPTE